MEAEMRRMLLAVVAVALLGPVMGAQTQGQVTTDIYFIDTEGGQSTLVHLPGERNTGRQGDPAARRG